MKHFIRYFLLIQAAVFFHLHTHAQKLIGKYVAGNEYLEFKDNNVHFEIDATSGITFMQRGEGTYNIIGDYMVIKLSEWKGIKSTVDSICLGGKSRIYVHDDKGDSLAFVTLVFYDNHSKIIGEFQTKNDGLCFPTLTGIDSIAVSFVGYSTFKFKYLPNCNYSVKLVDGMVLENSVAILRIVERSETRLKIVTISTNYESEKPTESELKKFEKKMHSYFWVVRRFDKV